MMACVHGRSWTYFVCFSFRKTIHGRPDPWTCSQTGPSGEIGPSSLVLVLPPFWEDGRANRTNRISRRIRRCIHQESRRRARRGDPATRGCHVTRGVQTTGSSVPDMRRKWLCEMVMSLGWRGGCPSPSFVFCRLDERADLQTCSEGEGSIPAVSTEGVAMCTTRSTTKASCPSKRSRRC